MYNLFFIFLKNHLLGIRCSKQKLPDISLQLEEGPLLPGPVQSSAPRGHLPPHTFTLQHAGHAHHSGQLRDHGSAAQLGARVHRIHLHSHLHVRGVAQGSRARLHLRQFLVSARRLELARLYRYCLSVN
jgi:hypothetical protein